MNYENVFVVVSGIGFLGSELRARFAKDAAPKSSPVQKSEIQRLRERVSAQTKELQILRSALSSVDSGVLKAPFGRFLLVKDGPKCLALRITEYTNFVRDAQNLEHHTTKYEWFLQNDSSMDFSKANVQHGRGDLDDFKNGVYKSAYIRAGSFPQLEWSASDWIYFQLGGTPVGGYLPGSKEDRRAKTMRMALTEWMRIEDVRPRDAQLVWWTQAQTQKFAERAKYSAAK